MVRHDEQTHTFRGRSMREAVAALKGALGPDAVIVSTRRGRDPRGRYVEISAVGRPQPAPAPSAARRIDLVAGDEPTPAMGGPRGASAAYARTARATQPTALPPLLAALRGEPPAEKPFAERAAWLARQIEQRTAEHALDARPAPLPGVAERPPYHTVDAPPPAPRSRILSPAEAAAELARPDAADSEVRRLRAEIEALKELVGGMGRTPAGPGVDVASAVADALAPLAAQLSALARQAPAQTQLADVRSLLHEVTGEPPAIVEPEPPTPTLERPAFAEGPDPLMLRLIDAGVPRAHADDLVRRARPKSLRPVDPLDRISAIIADDIDCGLADFEQRRVLAFVGPTGVGKTTTVAKLAVRARLAGKSVALVTVDTFRMAAVDQLARYAEVLEAPLRVVKHPRALGPTLAELAEYDVVLIDTTGRNPRGDAAAALAKFFPEGWGGELVLTVACGTRERDAFATVDAFAELGYAALCITKTDESDAPGAIYGIARRSGRPVAWLTDGQMVPDDIEDARSATIAARIVGHRMRRELALGA